jgi:class 3 adenylate cyclase
LDSVADARHGALSLARRNAASCIGRPAAQQGRLRSRVSTGVGEGVGVAELPSGTVTFLFTDLEGSTRLWEEHPDAMHGALARHDQILRGTVESHDGHVVKTTGDGIHATFPSAQDALDAAVVMQRELAAETFGDTGPLLVRMGYTPARRSVATATTTGAA